MHVCQVAVEGCSLHHLPTLETLNIPGVPLSRSDTATSQTPVRISRELGTDPTRGTDHRLCLGHVRLKPHPRKKTHGNHHGDVVCWMFDEVVDRHPNELFLRG